MPRKRKLKVYRTVTFVRKGDREKDEFFTKFPWRCQAEYVAAVFNFKEFCDLLGQTVGETRGYSSRTGNKESIEKAMANPHTLIFIRGH